MHQHLLNFKYEALCFVCIFLCATSFASDPLMLPELQEATVTESDPLPLPEYTDLMPTDPASRAPDTTVALTQQSNDIADSSNLQKTSVSPAIRRIRDLLEEEESYKYSVSVGVQSYLVHDPYPKFEFEGLLLSRVSLGFLVNSMGKWGTSGGFSALSGFATLNLHSGSMFRGLWLQVGGGLVYCYQTERTAGASSDLGVTWIPSGIGTLGVRWRLRDFNGKDDGFSMSISGGLQYMMGTYHGADLNINGMKILPVIRAQIDWSY